MTRGCLDGVDIPKDQLNTVIREVMHMVLTIPVTEEAKVMAISEVIQARNAQAQVDYRLRRLRTG